MWSKCWEYTVISTVDGLITNLQTVHHKKMWYTTQQATVWAPGQENWGS